MLHRFAVGSVYKHYFGNARLFSEIFRICRQLFAFVAENKASRTCRYKLDVVLVFKLIRAVFKYGEAEKPIKIGVVFLKIEPNGSVLGRLDLFYACRQV